MRLTKGDKVRHMFVSLGGILFGKLFTLGLIHFARYMRLTKGDKVNHMFVSLGAIHFGELFTLGLIHFARYMRLTKGDKVKHMFVSLGAMHFGEGHMPIVYRSRPPLLRNQKFYPLHTCSKWNNTWPSLFSYNI